MLGAPKNGHYVQVVVEYRVMHEADSVKKNSIHILLNKCICLNKRVARPLSLHGCISETTELILIIFLTLTVKVCMR